MKDLRKFFTKIAGFFQINQKLFNDESCMIITFFNMKLKVIGLFVLQLDPQI